MNTTLRTWIMTALLAAAAALFSLPAAAQSVTVIGTISQITLAPDGKAADVMLKDEQTGKDVPLRITDDETLDKFKDKRISEGDEARVRYEAADGKNQSKSFRKAGGC